MTSQISKELRKHKSEIYDLADPERRARIIASQKVRALSPESTSLRIPNYTLRFRGSPLLQEPSRPSCSNTVVLPKIPMSSLLSSKTNSGLSTPGSGAPAGGDLVDGVTEALTDSQHLEAAAGGPEPALDPLLESLQFMLLGKLPQSVAARADGANSPPMSGRSFSVGRLGGARSGSPRPASGFESSSPPAPLLSSSASSSYTSYNPATYDLHYKNEASALLFSNRLVRPDGKLGLPFLNDDRMVRRQEYYLASTMHMERGRRQPPLLGPFEKFRQDICENQKVGWDVLRRNKKGIPCDNPANAQVLYHPQKTSYYTRHARLMDFEYQMYKR